MAFENTVTSVGEAALTDSIITRSITELCDESVGELGRDSLHGCTQLRVADFPNLEKINTDAFRDCSSLDMLVLRNSLMCSLSYNALYGTPIANGTGYVYVPKSLENTYKQSSSWSALANQIRAIEDYAYLFSNLGKVWELGTARTFSGKVFAYGNDVWVGGCSNNAGIYYSTDGKQWKSAQVSGGDLYNVTFADGLFVAAFHYGSSSRGYYYSTDGKTWTKGDYTGNAYSVVCGNGVWVGSAANAGGVYSTDGKTWVANNLPSSGCRSLTFANGMFFASEFSTYSSPTGLHYSVDGITWTKSNLTSGAFYSPAYGDGIYVVGGAQGVYYSADGITWTKSNLTSGSFYDAAYADGIFVIGSTTGLYYSADGITWTKSNMTDRTKTMSPVYANGVWVTGQHYSVDGKYWEANDGLAITSAIYEEGLLAAYVDAKGFYYSEP